MSGFTNDPVKIKAKVFRLYLACTNEPSQAEDCNGDCNPCVEAPCHTDATCTNIDGTAVCECNDGFDGDGTACTGTFDVTMKILGLIKY